MAVILCEHVRAHQKGEYARTLRRRCFVRCHVEGSISKRGHQRCPIATSGARANPRGRGLLFAPIVALRGACAHGGASRRASRHTPQKSKTFWGWGVPDRVTSLTYSRPSFSKIVLSKGEPLAKLSEVQYTTLSAAASGNNTVVG